MNFKKIIVLGGVGMVSAAVGVLLPTMMSGSASPAPTDSTHVASSHEADAGHGADHSAHETKKEAAPKAEAHDAGHGGGHGDAHGGKDKKKVPKVGPVYLHFDRIVVNLNDPQLVRFLNLQISVQTDGKYEDEVAALMDEKRPVLRTFLCSHLADKTVDDVRGRVGVNRLRREIQDNFNALLFKDGHERIQDILFEEFQVP